MSEKALIHAIWAAALMYCVAVVALAAVSYNRAPLTAEDALAKVLALFGPITALLTALFARRREPKE